MRGSEREMTAAAQQPDVADTDVAVIGMAGRFPRARDVDEFWRNLVQGVECIATLSEEQLRAAGVSERMLRNPNYVRARGVLEDADRFDAGFFGYRPFEAMVIDPQQRVFLECAWEALEDAGYDPFRFPGAVGVYAGANFTNYLEYLQRHAASFPGFDGWEALVGSDKDYLATRVSYKLDLRGPSLTVQTACSTSLVAIHVACQAVIASECEMALAGGVGIPPVQEIGYLYQEGGKSSPDGHCRAFDAGAQGVVGGAGAGVVVLKRLADALRDGDHVYAVIKGSAVNNDGALKVSFTAPSVEGQSQVVSEALSVAGVDPDTVTFVEGHGTGTPLGDPIEVAALTQAFRASTAREQYCALGSAKTNIGHLTAAAGVAGLIKVVQAMRHGVIPPTLHFRAPNPELRLERSPFYVNTRPVPWTPEGPRRAGVSSLGIGGTNAHLVVEEPPAPAESGPARPWSLLALSARSPAALDAAAARLRAFLAENPDAKLADVAYTLQVGRAELAHRRVLACRSVQDAVEALGGGDPARVWTAQAGEGALPAAFLFPGGGAQRAGMARELYGAEPVFRETVDRCAELLRPELGWDVREVLLAEETEEAAARIDRADVAHPALFVVEYALAQTWMAWGVRPAAVMGHSLGEYAAACVAGVFTLEAALRLVAERGRLMQSAPEGAMLVVPLAEAELLPLLDEGLSIGAVNGPELCLVSGAPGEVEAFAARMEARGIDCRRLHFDRASHCALMDGVLDAFRQAVRAASPAPARIPFVSNLTGGWIDPERLADPEYWVSHLRQPVRFADGLAALRERPGVLLEVGPGQALTKLARRQGGPAAPAFASLTAPGEEGSDLQQLLTALGRCWAAGVKVDWNGFGARERRLRLRLPTYPFERTRFALPTTPAPATAAPAAAAASDQDLADRFALLQERPAASTIITDVVPMPLPTAEPARVERIRRTLTGLIGRAFGFPEGEMDAHAGTSLLELGADSLLLMRVSRAIENETGVAIPFRRLMGELSSIDAMAAHLDAELPPEPEAAPPPAAAPAAESSATPGFAAPAHVSAPAEAGAIERVIAQQMQLMHRQLELLRGAPLSAAPAPANGTASAAPAASAATTGSGGSNGAASGSGASTGSTASTASTTSSASTASTVTGGSNGAAGGSAEPQAFGPFQPVRRTSATLDAGQKEALDTLVREYVAQTRGSRDFAERYRDYLADPRATAGFRLTWKDMVYPIVGRRAQGSHLWDVDGNEYVDYTMGFGVYLLGHAPPMVAEAVRRQLEAGYPVGPQSGQAGRVAELVCRLTGAERAAFCNSGTEAMMAAVRLARATTGRKKIALFTGAYHGTFDGVLARAGREGSIPVAPGIPEGMVEDVLVLEYGSPAALDAVRAHAGELAAVLVEPVQSRRPELQPRQFLHDLRAITAETGVALVFDEIITGFRVHPGGAQGWFGVQADLATYGKVIGGGLPIGIIAGRRDFLDRIDGGAWRYGDASVPQVPQTMFAGTFSKHPLSMAAAEAVLDHLIEQGPALQEGLNARTAALAGGLSELFVREEVPIQVPTFSSFFRFQRAPEATWLDLLFFHMVRRGIYVWEARGCFLSTAHTQADVDRLLEVTEDAIGDLRRDGFLPARREPAVSSTSTVEADGQDEGMEAEEHETADAEASARTPAEPREVPATAPQRLLWSAAQLGEGASLAYNEQLALHLRGPLRVDALRDALSALAARHDALRASFSADGERLRIAPPATVELEAADVEAAYREREAALVRDLLEREVTTPFDLGRGPLFRCRLFRLAPEHHLFALTFHHVVVDGFSVGVLQRELWELYAAFVEGRAPRLAAAAQLGDHAAAQAGGERADVQAAERYWLAQTEDAAPPALPADAARSAGGATEGNRETMVLDAELLRGLRELTTRSGATLFTTLVSAFLALVHRLSAQDDVTIGIPSLGRAFDGDEGMVGHVVDLLPLRSRVRPDTEFSVHLGKVKKALLEAYEHEAFPYSRLAQARAEHRDAEAPRLITVTFNLEPGVGREGGFTAAGVEVAQAPAPLRHVKFDLHLNLTSLPDGIRLSCDHSLRFRPETVRRWMRQYRAVLRQVVADPNRPLDALALLDDEERHRVVREWNETDQPFAGEPVHQAVARQAARAPHAVALVDADGPVTYGALEERANRLARHLREAGVGPESRVGVAMERSAEMVVALLAILNAGGAYVPLDLEYPAERLAYLLADCGAAALVVADALPAPLSAFAGPVVSLRADRERIDAHAADPLPDEAHPEQLAYVIYTSGSTGRPKGVMVPHAGLANLVGWHLRAYALTPDDRCAQVASPAFDAAAWETWPALAAGAALHLAPPRVPAPGAEIAAWLAEHRVTAAFLPTPYLNAGLAELEGGSTALRVLLTGGDLLQSAPTEAAGFRLVNHYGPTENTVVSTAVAVPAGEAGTPPIGRPIDNTRAYVLDARMQPVPVGVEGELFVAGAQVARGYLGRPGMTAERFVPDPFSRQAGARLYRTGDLVRWTDAGVLDFVGRADQQVKLRGFRIEPGEVEAALRRHPRVRDAAVAVRDDAPGGRALVAWLVAEGEAPAPGELRSFLGGHLPAHMVPSAFVALAELPLTPNGKVDRAALPAPDARALSAAGHVPPRNDVEEVLCGIWSEVLGIDPIGVHDDFFLLGGQSLLAVKIATRVRGAFEVPLEVRALLEHPTVAGLGGVVEALLLESLGGMSDEEAEQLLSLQA